MQIVPDGYHSVQATQHKGHWLLPILTCDFAEPLDFVISLI